MWPLKVEVLCLRCRRVLADARVLEFFVRRFSCTLALFAGALTLVFGLSACTRPDLDKPNFILIMTDDQPLGLMAFMPTVQRELVDKGVRFEQAFAPTPLCCPARASVLRGQYVHNHGLLSNGGPQGGFPKFYASGREQETLATWLHDAGYRTAMLGKYMNGYPYGLASENPPDHRAPRRSYIPPGWDEWFGLFDVPQDPRNYPYAMYDYHVNDNGREVHYGRTEDDYQVDVLSARADRFIRQSRRGPFFLYISPTTPHLPTVVAPRHRGVFRDVKAPRPPSFNEADTRDKPRWLRRVPPLGADDLERIDHLYRKQAEMMLAVDELLATILDTLRRTGELDNTYIVFTADQGFQLGENRLAAMKLAPYAASSQIPLLIRGPGIPAGQSLDHLALNLDLAPTLADLAGVTPPGFVDGRSLKPLWQEDEGNEPWRQAALFEFWPRESIEGDGHDLGRLIEVPRYRAVRSRALLYTEYFYPDGSRDGELYDLTRDPFELENLYTRTDPAVLEALSSYAEALQACAAESCRALENTSPKLTEHAETLEP